MESVLNFKLHQRVVSVVFRCYNAFRCAVQGSIIDAVDVLLNPALEPLRGIELMWGTSYCSVMWGKLVVACSLL